MANVHLPRSLMLKIVTAVGLLLFGQANAQGVIIGGKPTTLDGVCPATDPVPPPNQRPWVDAARRYYGEAYAQAIDDHAIGIITYDEKVLERAITVLRSSNVSGAKSNAAVALTYLAQIRHDPALLDQALDLAVSDFRQYGPDRDKTAVRIKARSRLQEIELLLQKSGASIGPEAIALAAKAEALAHAGRRQFLDSPREASMFAILAAYATARQGALQDDWTKIVGAAGELRTAVAELTGEERVGFRVSLATTLIYSDEHAPSGQAGNLRREGKALASALLTEELATTSQARVNDAASRLNQTIGGEWGFKSDRDRCLRRATLRALIAIVDLEDARDDATRENARGRLEAADRQFSAIPLFQRDPSFQFFLARSFAQQMKGAPAPEQAALQQRGARAFREASRLRNACFCRDQDAAFAALEGTFGRVDAGPAAKPEGGARE